MTVRDPYSIPAFRGYNSNIVFQNGKESFGHCQYILPKTDHIWCKLLLNWSHMDNTKWVYEIARHFENGNEKPIPFSEPKNNN